VVDAAGVGAGLWLSYLFVLLYLLIAAGGVRQEDLFFESPVKLPFLNIDLPLKGFFILGPPLRGPVATEPKLHFGPPGTTQVCHWAATASFPKADVRRAASPAGLRSLRPFSRVERLRGSRHTGSTAKPRPREKTGGVAQRPAPGAGNHP
jgi:hypothetical protein